MSLYDLLYLDEGWLRSLASQTRGDVQKRTHETRGESSGGKHDPGSHWFQKVDAGSVVEESAVLDDRFADFFRAVEGAIVRLDASTYRTGAAAALDSGAFVAASGSFFYDDFVRTRELVAEAATYISFQPKLQPGKPAQAPVEMIEVIGELIEKMFAETIECGVLVGNNKDALVRATLAPGNLRPAAKYVLDRYGARTRARFTIVGTICRIGWEPQVFLSDAEEIASRALTGGPQIAAPEEDPMRTAIRQVQQLGMTIRRFMLSGKDASSVFLTPLAVFREIPL